MPRMTVPSHHARCYSNTPAARADDPYCASSQSSRCSPSLRDSVHAWLGADHMCEGACLSHSLVVKLMLLPVIAGQRPCMTRRRPYVWRYGLESQPRLACALLAEECSFSLCSSTWRSYIMLSVTAIACSCRDHLVSRSWNMNDFEICEKICNLFFSPYREPHIRAIQTVHLTWRYRSDSYACNSSSPSRPISNQGQGAQIGVEDPVVSMKWPPWSMVEPTRTWIVEQTTKRILKSRLKSYNTLRQGCSLFLLWPWCWRSSWWVWIPI